MERIEKKQQFPISTFLTVMANEKGIPLHGVFELTARCNFNCRMCYVHKKTAEEGQRMRELSTARWLEIAEEAKRCGTLTLLLTGGEVLLREDFVELYRKLAVMGMRISINTNGSLMREEVLECFRKYPPARVNISLYGDSEETYGNLCGVRAAAKVKETIRTLKAMGLSVRETITLTPFNCQDMEKVYTFARQENTLLNIGAYMFPQNRVEEECYGRNRGRLSPEEAGRYEIKGRRLQMPDKEFVREARIRLEDAGIDPGKGEEHCGDPIRCQAGRSSYWITWDGRLRPCGLMTEPEADVNTMGFEAAWKQVHGMAEEIRLPIECKSCRNRRLCRVCASMCQSETGHFDRKPEYRCRMVEAMRKQCEEELKKLGGDS